MLQKAKSIANLAADVRFALLAFALVLTVHLATPGRALPSGCPPGSGPATGCECEEMPLAGGGCGIPIGCCTDDNNDSQCLYQVGSEPCSGEGGPVLPGTGG